MKLNKVLRIIAALQALKFMAALIGFMIYGMKGQWMVSAFFLFLALLAAGFFAAYVLKIKP